MTAPDHIDVWEAGYRSGRADLADAITEDLNGLSAGIDDTRYGRGLAFAVGIIRETIATFE